MERKVGRRAEPIRAEVTRRLAPKKRTNQRERTNGERAAAAATQRNDRPAKSSKASIKGYYAKTRVRGREVGGGVSI